MSLADVGYQPILVQANGQALTDQPGGHRVHYPFDFNRCRTGYFNRHILVVGNTNARQWLKRLLFFCKVVFDAPIQLVHNLVDEGLILSCATEFIVAA